MKNTQCRDCGVPIPIRGHDGKPLWLGQCPHCGAYNPFPMPWKAIVVVIALFVVGVVGFSLLR